MTTPIPDLLAASCRAFALQLKPFGVSDVLSDAADLIQHQQATIERLSAALERAIEAIQAERDCTVECATMPPDHDLSTLDPDTKPQVEEYDAMLAYLRTALGKDAK